MIIIFEETNLFINFRATSSGSNCSNNIYTTTDFNKYVVCEDFKVDIKLEVRDVDFNMSEEEIESGIEEPLDPALENIAR
jgi:hypothetical protein